MTVYIESFVVQNFLINFCLLRLVKITTRAKSSVGWMSLSSVFGVVFSVLASLVLLDTTLLNLLKIFCSVMMVGVCFKSKGRQFWFNLILLFLYTYALGGAVMSLSNSVSFSSGGVIMSSDISIEAVALIVIGVSFVYELVLKHIKFKIKSNNLIYTIILSTGEKQIKLDAYLDTGNLLTYEGQPVIIVELESFLRLTRSSIADFYLNKGQGIKTSTVNGCQSLKLFRVNYIELLIGKEKRVYKNQYIAVSANHFSGGDYQALLSPKMI